MAGAMYRAGVAKAVSGEKGGRGAHSKTGGDTGATSLAKVGGGVEVKVERAEVCRGRREVICDMLPREGVEGAKVEFAETYSGIQLRENGAGEPKLPKRRRLETRECKRGQVFLKGPAMCVYLPRAKNIIVILYPRKLQRHPLISVGPTWQF